jgi:DNA-binding CsgD family transcriptional regulator
MTTTCLLAWAAVLLLMPIIVLAWATESQGERARRWRRSGHSQQAIADRLGVTRYRVRQLLS